MMLKQNALVYFMPEGETPETISSDWRTLFMSELSKDMQEGHMEGIVPIV